MTDSFRFADSLRFICSPRCFLSIWLCIVLCCASALGQLRIVSYNTATGEQGGQPTLPRAGLDTVLEAIGAEEVNEIARPIDVLLLQEQSSAASTTQEIVNLLNAIYGDGAYAMGHETVLLGVLVDLASCTTPNPFNWKTNWQSAISVQMAPCDKR